MLDIPLLTRFPIETIYFSISVPPALFSSCSLTSQGRLDYNNEAMLLYCICIIEKRVHAVVRYGYVICEK